MKANYSKAVAILRMPHSKKILLAAFLIQAFMLFTVSLKAQDREKGSEEERAKALTDKMKERCPITDSVKYQQVYEINLEYNKKLAEEVKNAEGRLAKLKAAKSVQKEKNKEMKSVLSKEEYKNYEALMEEVKEEMKSRFRNRDS